MSRRRKGRKEKLESAPVVKDTLDNSLSNDGLLLGSGEIGLGGNRSSLDSSSQEFNDFATTTAIELKSITSLILLLASKEDLVLSQVFIQLKTWMNNNINTVSGSTQSLVEGSIHKFSSLKIESQLVELLSSFICSILESYSLIPQVEEDKEEENQRTNQGAKEKLKRFVSQESRKGGKLEISEANIESLSKLPSSKLDSLHTETLSTLLELFSVIKPHSLASSLISESIIYPLVCLLNLSTLARLATVKRQEKISIALQTSAAASSTEGSNEAVPPAQDDTRDQELGKEFKALKSVRSRIQTALSATLNIIESLSFSPNFVLGFGQLEGISSLVSHLVQLSVKEIGQAVLQSQITSVLNSVVTDYENAASFRENGGIDLTLSKIRDKSITALSLPSRASLVSVLDTCLQLDPESRKRLRKLEGLADMISLISSPVPSYLSSTSFSSRPTTSNSTTQGAPPPGGLEQISEAPSTSTTTSTTGKGGSKGSKRRGKSAKESGSGNKSSFDKDSSTKGTKSPKSGANTTSSPSSDPNSTSGTVLNDLTDLRLTALPIHLIGLSESSSQTKNYHPKSNPVIEKTIQASAATIISILASSSERTRKEIIKLDGASACYKLAFGVVSSNGSRSLVAEESNQANGEGGEGGTSGEKDSSSEIPSSSSKGLKSSSSKRSLSRTSSQLSSGLLNKGASSPSVRSTPLGDIYTELEDILRPLLDGQGIDLSGKALSSSITALSYLCTAPLVRAKLNTLGIGPIVKLLAAPSDEIQCAAALVLAALAPDYYIRTQMTQHDALLALLNSFVSFAKSFKTKANAVLALAKVAEADQEFRIEVRRLGIAKHVLAVLEKQEGESEGEEEDTTIAGSAQDKEQLRTNCLAFLAHSCLDFDSRTKIRELGGTSIVTSIIKKSELVSVPTLTMAFLALARLSSESLTAEKIYTDLGTGGLALVLDQLRESNEIELMSAAVELIRVLGYHHKHAASIFCGMGAISVLSSVAKSETLLARGIISSTPSKTSSSSALPTSPSSARKLQVSTHASTLSTTTASSPPAPPSSINTPVAAMSAAGLLQAKIKHCIEALLTQNLSAKYWYTGDLDEKDTIGREAVFYDVSAVADFLDLETLSSAYLNSKREVVLVDRDHDASLREWISSLSLELGAPALAIVREGRTALGGVVETTGPVDARPKTPQDSKADSNRAGSSTSTTARSETYEVKDQIQTLAKAIAARFGGSMSGTEYASFPVQFDISRAKHEASSNVIHLGSITKGALYHRGLAFKYLCDIFSVAKCRLTRGPHDSYKGVGNVWNTVSLEDGSEFVVDLLTEPGKLYAANSLEAKTYTTI